MQSASLLFFASLCRGFIAIFLISTLRLQAASGDLDPNYHGPTNAIPNGYISFVSALTNGQFLISGTFTTDFGLPVTPRNNFARFNADGSIDSSFQGPAMSVAISPALVGVAVQSDSKIVVSGYFTVATPSRTNWIRLNTDGSVDSTFDAGSRPPTTFTIQGDGKILLKDGRTRLNIDGSLDTDYQPAAASTSCSAVLPDQNIVIAGTFTSFGGFPRKGLVRLLPNGQVDETFAPTEGPQIGSVTTIVPFKTNIWIAGGFSQFGTTSVGGLVRLSLDGQRDTSFVFPGPPQGISQVIPLDDGSIVIRGSFTQISGQPRPGLARLFADGSLDPNFNPTITGVRNATIQSNGDILIAGGFTPGNKSGIMRLLGLAPSDSLQFTTSPQSISANVGDAVAFQALASGSPPLHYQWFLNDNPIPNATNVTLKYRAVSFEQAGEFSISVSNATFSAQSPPATLTLTDIPTPPGSIDRTFALPLGTDGTVFQIVVQPDDRILVCGNFLHIDNHAAPGFARLLNDGSFDSSFAPNLGSSISGNQVNAMAVQPDGKIVVAGRFGTSTNVLRLNADGSPDPSLRKPLFGATTPMYSVAVELNGSIIAVGGNSRINYDPSGVGSTDPAGAQQYGTNANTILVTPQGRYLGGSYLTRFSYPSSIDDSFFFFSAPIIQAFALQTDGSLLAGGTFQSVPNFPNGGNRRALVRLDRYGKYDSSFDAAVPENVAIRAIVLQSDDRAIIAGSTNQLRRLNSTGQTDPSFSPIFDGEFNALALTHDGKLLVGGTFTTVNGESHPHIVRLNLGERSAPRLVFTNADQTIAQGSELRLRAPAEGYPAPTYTWMLKGEVLNGETNAVLRRANFFAADAGEYSVIVSNSEGSVTNKFTISAADVPTTPGSVNLSWFNGGGFNDVVNAFALTPDDKVLIGGDFAMFDGKTRWKCVRLNPDQSLDDTLMTGPNYTNGFDGPISALVSLPDGSFLAGGSFYSSRLQLHRGLARIGTNNLADPTFFSDAGFTNISIPFGPLVTSLALQGGSNFIAGGAFLTCDGLDRPGLARIQFDGSLDTNFVTGDFGPIYAVAAQKDQKIWAGGTNIVHLNADGSTDLTLSWGNSTNDSVKALLIQPDDKVLVAGVSLSGHSLIRLNADATIDSSFTPLDLDTNFTDVGVYALELQPDGKIIAGGKFTTANGAPVANIVRLNADGTIDTSFHAELTFAGPAGKAIVKALRLNGADTLLVGGYFDQANGLPRYCAAALGTGAGTIQILRPTLHLANDGAILTLTFATQPGVNYTIESAATVDSANWTPLPNAPHNTGEVQVAVSSSNQFFRVVARP